jgi:hypothetical protein
MVFNTTWGEIKFNVYETVGQEVSLDPFDYMEADCAIVMFDVTRSCTFYNIQRWSSNVIRASGKRISQYSLSGTSVTLKTSVSSFRTILNQIRYHRHIWKSWQ